MPRYPHVHPELAAMEGSLFSKLAHRVAAIQGERYPLHVGDTWLEPAPGCRMQDFTVDEHPGMHRYATPHGHPLLLEAIEERRGVTRDRVLVTAGVTGGLGAVAGALLSPGDEVLILTPFWPLIAGIVRAARAVPVQVPFYDRTADVSTLVEPFVTDRTVALYVNTPNNPTGKVLAPDVLQSLADLARSHELWLWSDEVYENYAYTSPHVSPARFAPERTFCAYSFSKAYGMAGNRCGYLVGPSDPACMGPVRKIATHSFYSAPTASQLAAAQVLRTGDPWLEQTHAAYMAAGNAAADTLGEPHPEGGTFLFVDVAQNLDERGLEGFLLDCIDQNLVLAPGSSCGRDYGHYVRVCFTSAPPDVVDRGITRLATLLER
ncbi:MAG: pyridoxal phosphate-dependent aminotransferase [Myxococcota bacterium]|nr:pyridoxal phosphate-dependent aminotransferase [Myxococcota bacterium]